MNGSETNCLRVWHQTDTHAYASESVCTNIYHSLANGLLPNHWGPFIETIYVILRSSPINSIFIYCRFIGSPHTHQPRYYHFISISTQWAPINNSRSDSAFSDRVYDRTQLSRNNPLHLRPNIMEENSKWVNGRGKFNWFAFVMTQLKLYVDHVDTLYEHGQTTSHNSPEIKRWTNETCKEDIEEKHFLLCHHNNVCYIVLCCNNVYGSGVGSCLCDECLYSIHSNSI